MASPAPRTESITIHLGTAASLDAIHCTRDGGVPLQRWERSASHTRSHGQHQLDSSHWCLGCQQRQWALEAVVQISKQETFNLATGAGLARREERAALGVHSVRSQKASIWGHGAMHHQWPSSGRRACTALSSTDRSQPVDLWKFEVGSSLMTLL